MRPAIALGAFLPTETGLDQQLSHLNSPAMNPFSPNYKSQQPEEQIKLAIRDSKISATRSRQRAEGMASDDPAVRKQASGTLGNGKLSKRGKK